MIENLGTTLVMLLGHARILFNASSYENFKEVLELAGQYGSVCKPPSMYVSSSHDKKKR